MIDREIKVYSTPNCPWCKKLKKFLDDNGVKYQDFNVAEDKSAREEMLNKCHQLAVPTICFGDEVIVGFNESQLREKLGI